MIGPHLPLGGGLLKAAERAAQIGATAIQVFTDNPTAWRRRSAPPGELQAFRERLKAAGVDTLAVHAPYLVNLCGGRDDFWQQSVVTMVNELRVAEEYSAEFLVMHIGSHRGFGRDAGIERLIAGLAAVFDATPAASPIVDRHPPRLVLENSAGTGDGIGSSLEDLADIYSAAAAAGLPLARLGICLDTAHLWGAGYGLLDEAGVRQVTTRVEELLGRDKVVMMHLNDSRAGRGSRLDRHEHIGAGEIGERGMRALLSEPWLATLPTFLETPGMDAGYDQTNLERACQLMAGEQLPPLPREAFGLRGSRARSAPPPDPVLVVGG